MQPNSPPSITPTPHPGLPPVQPPSGQMILRLFLVPFTIVAVLVLLYVGGRALHDRTSGAHAPEHYLQLLDNSNPDIRWRAASDLSQELPRSPKLAADATFALELADRLQTATDDSAGPEKEFAAKAPKLSAEERNAVVSKELDP